MKFRRDISSRRLFCKGVPVSSKRCSACTGGREERRGGGGRERESERDVKGGAKLERENMNEF